MTTQEKWYDKDFITRVSHGSAYTVTRYFRNGDVTIHSPRGTSYRISGDQLVASYVHSEALRAFQDELDAARKPANGGE